MNQKILIAVSAVLLLAGCTKTELAFRNDGRQEIQFSSYTGRAVTKTASTYDQQYRVRAYYGSKSYFNDVFVNDTLTYTGGTTTTVYYWPAEMDATNSMTFYAVAPSTNSISDDKKITFTADGSADLLAYKTDAYTSKPSGAVPIAFKHVLSNINSITVKADSTDATATASYKYEISALKIKGKKSGTYDYTSWTVQGDSLDYAYTTSSSSYFMGNVSKLFSETKILVPQELVVYVTYKISFGGKTILNTTTKSGKFTVKSGNVYALTITLPSGADLSGREIKFNASVSSWNDGGNKDTDVQPYTILPGEFSVSASKKVKFTRGNLYWNGSAWAFEGSQTSHPTDYDPSHVGHFYWANTTDWQTSGKEPYALNYSYSSRSSTDKFFCGEANEMTVESVSNLYALSHDEWSYLLNTRSYASSKMKFNVTVNGVAGCLVLAPDNYSGTITSSYTAGQWAIAEAAGLVCLPPAGYRSGNSIIEPEKGYYATPSGSSETLYDIVLFTDSQVNPGSASSSFTFKDDGSCIRLVQTVNN